MKIIKGMNTKEISFSLVPGYSFIKKKRSLNIRAFGNLGKNLSLGVFPDLNSTKGYDLVPSDFMKSKTEENI